MTKKKPLTVESPLIITTSDILRLRFGTDSAIVPPVIARQDSAEAISRLNSKLEALNPKQ